MKRSSFAAQFARRLNNYNTKCMEMGDPLFKPVDQIKRHESDFPVSQLSLDNGCRVMFADGSRAAWDRNWRIWNIEPPLLSTAPTEPSVPHNWAHKQNPDLTEAWEQNIKLLDQIYKLQNEIQTLKNNLPDHSQIDILLDQIKAHDGVSDAFLLVASPAHIEIAAAVDCEFDFEKLSFEFDSDATNSMTITVRRYISCGQWFSQFVGGKK